SCDAISQGRRVAALRDNDPPEPDGNDLSTLSDEALVRLAQADPARFGALYERYAVEITRFYLARCRSR
ncbi:MAG: hypothetical protein M3457_05075, partial [Chloroflexota bacterium]|nr:hypothetical protein [Chloroflexota bacterium]